MSQAENFDIEYVAGLARIELSEDEKAAYSAQLGQALKYFEALSKVDVANVEPSSHAYAVYNVWREDEAAEPLDVAVALQNAPAKRDNQVIVPKVVDDA